MLGTFDDTEFKAHDAYLNKNDILFLYTDGVTEAQNKDLEMYGENRLEQTLNKTTTENLQEIISVVKSDIKNFTGDIPQSDDTTMLAFRFNQNPKFLYKDTASTENYSEFHKWVKNICNIFNISNNIKNKIEIITEEIYLNVAFYAYKKNTGTIEVEFIKVNDTLTIIFTDSGIEYNPLIKEEPDIDIPLEERDAGGMGIFMVKNYADNCEYEYKNGKNILKIMLYI